VKLIAYFWVKACFYALNFMSKTNETRFIFDPIRQKRIVLTPEEEVRQQLIQYLIHERAYPKGLIGVEKGLLVYGRPRRFDILVHNTHGQPLMLIECKAKSVNLSQQTFDQVARYNIALRVPWLVISNGVEMYCAQIDFESSDYKFVPDIPQYAEL